MSFIANEVRIEEILIKEYCKYVEEEKSGTLRLEMTFYKGKLMGLVKSDKQNLAIEEVDVNPLNRMRFDSQKGDAHE